MSSGPGPAVQSRPVLVLWTCDQRGPLRVAAHGSDGCRNVQNQVRLFGPQAAAVQVPQADTRLLVGPVSVVGSVQGNKRT